MRRLRQIDEFRDASPSVVSYYGSAGDDASGVFRLHSPVDSGTLTAIASSGEGWDHVSVSRPDRCPTWEEMEFVKRKFFKPDEVAMQLHVAVSDHISRHPNCLHIWRPTHQKLPLPPTDFV